NPGTEQELFNMDQLIQSFSLERVGKSGSKFDPEKTKWFNHQYLIRRSDEEIASEFIPFLLEKGIEADIQFVARAASLVKERLNFVKEVWGETYFFFQSPESYDDQVIKKRWKDETPSQMLALTEVLQNIEPFDVPSIDAGIKTWIEANNFGMGAIMNALRLLLVGASKGPHLGDIMALIGKEETLMRIKKGIETIK
ncbi:MAG: glutamate--tRNA ligase, partial [Bacteroidales bacterium]|nr:glutamate--tRNA ligase [Bacteroidales bacterium]